MSLQELPQPILRIIVEYIPDVESLCNLDCASRELHKLTREDFVWGPRLERQWKIRQSHNSDESSSASSPSSSLAARDEFVRRYRIDKDVTLCVSRLRSTTEQLRMLYAFSFVMAKENDAADILWKLFQHHKREETQKFARGILRMLHCGSVCSDLRRVLNDDQSAGERLEDSCILTTSMFREMSSVEDKTAEKVKRYLDETANSIRRGFTDDMTLRAKLQHIDSFLFHNEATSFKGNVEDYYDFRNSLLDASIERRKAIPMTLAILYKFICRRLDILVEVIGLPRHILAYVPALNRFVDVFDGGRHLDRADCVSIVTSLGFRMQESYLNPLSLELILQRILNNIENCLVRHPTIQDPVSTRQRAAITAVRAIAGNPREDQLVDCRHLLVLTYVSEACVGTDISDW